MKKNKISIPIIITLFLVVSSFIPIIQIMILTLNGGLISIFEKLLNVESTKTVIVFNAIASIICLLWFYKQDKLGFDVLSAVISAFFLLSYFTFQIGDNIKSDNFYFLPLMVAGLLTGFALLLVGYLKK